MNSIIGLVKKFAWELLISIVNALTFSFFAFIWESADKTWEISLKSIVVFICLMVLAFWILLLSISLLTHFKDMNHKRRLYKKLSQYIINNEAVKSIQIYNISKLLKPSEYTDSSIEIKIERSGGITAEFFETNCILYDSYKISYDFYIRYYYDVFETIKDIDQKIRLNQKVSSNCLFYALEEIEKCCSGIMKDYLNISSIKDIKPEHYFYYRTLYVLANKGAIYGTLLYQLDSKEKFLIDGKSCKIDRVLVGKSVELEDALKCGKHSQYISAIMTGELYVFFHEPYSLKHNRSYFSSILNSSNNNKKQLLVVTFDLDCLSVLSEYDAVVRCEQIHSEINRVLSGRKEKSHI